MNALACLLPVVVSIPLPTITQERILLADTTRAVEESSDTITIQGIRRVDPSIFPRSRVVGILRSPVVESPVQRGSRIDSAWIDLFRLSLSAQFENRNQPSYRRNVEARDLYLLDSNIVRESLPELPEGKFIPISFPEIEDLAKQNGDVHFIRLAKLEIDTSTAEVVWERVSAVFSRKESKVIYVTNRIHSATYHLTSAGWKAGLAQIEFNDYLKPE